MISILYLIAAICFILALKGLSAPGSAKSGNMFGICGMALSCFAVYLSTSCSGFIIAAVVIGGAIGIFIAQKVSMTQLPEMMAGFHSLVGLAALLIDCAACFYPESFGISQGSIASLLEIGLGASIGAITFTGSVIAFLKLSGAYKSYPISLTFNIMMAAAIFVFLALFTITESPLCFIGLALFSLAFGITLIVPIGGADMPVIVSMLNSLSGWAAAGIGYTLYNDLLIITGALVGASGAILSYIMCKGMNRTLYDVIFSSGVQNGGGSKNSSGQSVNRSYRSGAAEDAAFLLQNARSVIVVPGYGMAVSHAQHAVKEMADILKKSGVTVKYAIHPVAGRMPGHMNVILAEASVPYEDVFELDEINSDFSTCDVAYVVGANDVTNPAAKNDPSSSIYGMPILEVSKAKTILFLKRSMGAGYAGVDNELFYAPNTLMLLGDAKKTTEEIVKALEI